MAPVGSKITLKLLINARSQKVLFAEAGKEFVDFLFSLLTLPLGSVIKLLSPRLMVGSIGKLYQSVENLNETYLVPSRDKSSLLQPIISSFHATSPLLLGSEAMKGTKYYYCYYCRRKVTSTKNINCPSCCRVMEGEVDFVVPSASAASSAAARNARGNIEPTLSFSFSASSQAFLPTKVMTGTKYYLCYYCSRKITSTRYINCPNCCQVMEGLVDFVVPTVSAASSAGAGNAGENEGFVKGVITYMITDDLEVTPLSAISSITLINRFSMKKDVQLEEKVVSVGMKEGLALLEASLDSLTVLTDVFLSSSKKAKAPDVTEIK